MPTKQKSGLYRTKVVIGHGEHGKPIVKWVSAKTKAGLEKAKAEVKDKYIEHKISDDVLFGQYAMNWYKIKKEPFVSASTRDLYATIFKCHIMPEFGMRNIRAITAMDLQEFLNRQTNLCETTLTHIITILKKVLGFAVSEGIVPFNAAASLERPNCKPVKEREALTPEDRQKVLEVIKSNENGLFMAVLYFLGVRYGEAIGLMWEDIDFDQHTVKIERDVDAHDNNSIGKLKTKNSYRVIPIPDKLYEMFVAKKAKGFIFGNGKPLSRYRAEKMWKELTGACGWNVVPYKHNNGIYYRSKYTPHCFRHNYVTMCWEAGIDAYTTAKLVGHSNVHTTLDIYTHLTNKKLQNIGTDINAMFGKLQ